jgi:hypothetical protein
MGAMSLDNGRNCSHWSLHGQMFHRLEDAPELQGGPQEIHDEYNLIMVNPIGYF